jgi:hypothetical protein
MARFPNEKLVPVIEDLFYQLIDMDTEKESEKRRFKEILIFFCRWEIKDISILKVLQSQEKLFKNRQRCHLYRHSCPWRKNSLNNHPAAYIITSKRCRQFIRPPQGGDFVSAKLLLIILCLRVPQLTVHPAVIGEQLAVWTICPLSNTAILSQKRQEKSHFNLPILPTQIE